MFRIKIALFLGNQKYILLYYQNLLKELHTYMNSTEKIDILILEDEKNTCEKLTNCINSKEYLNIVKVTNSSTDAISTINTILPNVIILDLELIHGEGDGILFLKQLKEIDPPNKPFIIVTTHNPSSHIHNLVRMLGADYVMYKHQKNYTEQSVIDLIDVSKDIILSTSYTLEESYTPILNDAAILSKNVKNSLNKIGINPKFKGYKYLHDAIILLIEGEDNNVFNILAKKYNVSSQSVIHAMQVAISKAWNCSPIDVLERYYTVPIPLDKDCPSVSEFLYYYKNELSML